MEGLDRPIPELTLRVPDTGPSQQQAMSNHAPSSPQHEEIDLAEINIDNPLQLFDDDYSLEDAINNFTQRHGLEDERAMIRKATYLEQDQEETSETKKHGLSISKKERREITSRDETSFWKQTASLKAAVFAFAALSGICQGMNQSVLNETGPYLAIHFNLQVRADGPRNNSDLFKYGALSACVPLAAGVISLFIADPLQNHLLGRRGAVFVSAVVSIIATIGAACCQSFEQLIGCRVLIWASLGAQASIISPFLAELAPVHLRGAMLSTWQISDALGILLGFIAGYIVKEHVTAVDPRVANEARWRILSLTPLIPKIPLVFVAYMIPESYIFLMKIRNYGKAARAACQYRRIDIQGFRDLVASHWQMEAEGALMEKRQSKASKQPRTIPLKERLGEQPPGLCKPLRCNRPVEDESGNVQTPSDTHLSGPTRRTKGKMRAYPLQTSPTRESRRDGAGEPSSATHSAHRQSEDSEEREREIEWENQRTPCFHRYHMKEINFFHRLWQIVADPRCRRALISCGMVQLAQALCGINAFAFFSSSLIDANLSDNFPLNLGISFGVVNFTFGLLTPYLSDRLGRTTLLLGGLPFMTLFMFILASVIVESNPAREPTVYLMTLLFTAVYSFTLGPAAFSLSAESFGSSVRECGMAAAVSINMLSLGIQLLVYPFITRPIHYWGSLFIYGFINVLALIGCFLFCVDTKNRTLDELHYSFELPSKLHFQYRWEVLQISYKHYTKKQTWKDLRKDFWDGVHSFGIRETDTGKGTQETRMRPGSKDWPVQPFHIWASKRQERQVDPEMVFMGHGQ